MLELIMLVGLPGTGKSTWVQSQGFYTRDDWMVLSTDNFIMSIADGTDQTYNEVFPAYIKAAERNLTEALEYAIESKMNIVWDQTNLSVATRRKKLARVPICYKKIAMVFLPPKNHDEWLNSPEREGKVIPPHIMTSMRSTYEEPTIYEGFCEIIKPYEA